ncbi:MAG: hypothetical protein H7249_16015 [Chitinophagaceae bacterium]|nr:hypothetical protein [Oligoflexus sp.]
MRMLCLGLVGVIAVSGCKTAQFKGGVSNRSNITNPATPTMDNTVAPTPKGTAGTPAAPGATGTPSPAGTAATPAAIPANSAITGATKNPDGSTTTNAVAPDGTATAVTTVPAGPTTTVVTKPDGTKTTTVIDPTGTVTATTTKPDGTVTTDTKKPDGTDTVVVKNPDGSVTTSVTTPNSDGTSTNVSQNGDGTSTTTTSTKPDGTVVIITKNPDGTTTTVTKQPPGTSTPSKSTDTFVNCPEFPDRMILAKLYQLPENSSKVPDFAKVKYLKDVCLKQLDVVDRDFKEGFPGIPKLVEWFALDINWRVNAPDDGVYTFYVNSDDGSRLYIDGNQIIDNDGLHEHLEKTNTVTLSKGWHSIHVTWYQGPRYRIALELFWKRPGAAKREYIPTTYFARPTF